MSSERQSDPLPLSATISVGPGAAAAAAFPAAAAVVPPPVPRFCDDDDSSESDEIVYVERLYQKVGMEVFRGIIPRTQQKVVVKRIFPEDEMHEAAKEEAQMLLGLDHPNIIKCLSVIEQKDCIDIVMEQGNSLANERKSRAFSQQEIYRIFLDICEALAYIHAQGIIHFDLKCDNIIMMDGRAKLADFGSSLRLGDARETKLGSLRGTSHFMSPEMITGGELTSSTDIWSLGATLYELVTGEAPFHGLGHTEAILYRIGRTKSLPLLPSHLEVPMKTADLIARCAHRDPMLRPTAQHLLSSTSG